MQSSGRRGLPVLLLLALLVFAACSGTSAPSASKSPLSPTPTTTTTPEPEPEPDVPPAPRWAKIHQVDPAGLDHLDTYTLSDNKKRIHIVVPQLTGHDEFNEYLQNWANQQEDSFLENVDPIADSELDGGEAIIATPSLTATWVATGISPTMVGFYLESTESPGASTAVYSDTVWYDPTDGELIPWQNLITDDARSSLVEHVGAALEEQGIEFDEDELAAALGDDGSPAIGFTKDGNLYVGFDSYELIAGYYGNPGIEIELESASEFLTEEGNEAREASLSPDTADVPPTPVVPEPPEPEESSVDCSKEKCVALTFDDGPSSKNTPKLLDILAKEQVPVTFFVLGTQAKAFPDIVARAREEGHEIASHTWKHANLTSLSGKALNKDLADSNRAIKSALGSTPNLMRPPYGATNKDVSKAAKKAGLALVMWDIDTLDWQHRDAKKTVKHAKEATAGSIILMHDIHETTVEAAPKVIKSLRKEGFTFVTVSQLIGETEPGESYFRGPSNK